MKKVVYLFVFVGILSVSTFAHAPFTLVSGQKRTVNESDLTQLTKVQTTAKIDGTNLTFVENEIRLVVVTGPEDDMLSYRIQDVRNPNLVVPAGATLKILFVNIDADMRHDIRFGHVMDEFPVAPDVTETAGASILAAKSADETMNAEEIVIKAMDVGAFKYFCSVRGHAKGGMWGNILVGVRPDDKATMAPKTTHVHSPDEDMSNMQKKPDEMENMKMDKPGTAPGMSDMQQKHKKMAMSSNINLGEPMSREGSGTSWVPDSSPMYAKMKMFGDGSMLMFHGTAFLRYRSIGSSRAESVVLKGGCRGVDEP
jgi:hypothetical protein